MTNELTTTSILSLFETNKEQRQDFAMRVVDSLDEGKAEPLKVHLQVKCMEDIIKLLNTNTRYKDHVLEAAKVYGEKSFQFQNSKVEIKEVGTKYDFSQCNDREIIELTEEQEKIAVKIKARETLLKALPLEGIDRVDENGEVVRIYPPSKSSTTSVAITLK